MAEMERNKKRVLEFWNSPPEVQKALLAPDVCWHLPTSIGRANFGATELRGDSARAIFGAASSVYEPGRTCDVHHLIAEGDLVSLHCTLHRRTRSGNDYHGSYHMLFRIEAEYIAEVWEFLDTAYLLECIQGPAAALDAGKPDGRGSAP